MNKKQKSLTNKGFSLVELIIVIAIMAVLVGVLAPQYLKYVHNSKVSTDVQNAQEMATAINVAIADQQKIFNSTTDKTITAASIPWTNTSLKAQATSKLSSTATFEITGNDTTGVTKITLKGVNNGAATPKNEYQVYPDPDSTTDGANQSFTGVGLKK